MLKSSKANLRKLEEVFKEQDYTIRYEKGNFQSGYCIVENKKVIIINRFFDLDARINCLLDIFSLTSMDISLYTPKTLVFYKQLVQSMTLQKAG